MASCPQGGITHDLWKRGAQGGGGSLDTFPPAPQSTGLGEPSQNPGRELEKTDKKVSPGILKMKQIFEKQNIKEGVDSKEAEGDNRVRQISNTFENVMDRGKRKTTERREKQREIDKKRQKEK